MSSHGHEAQRVSQAASAWCHDGGQATAFTVVRSGILTTAFALDLRKRTTAGPYQPPWQCGTRVSGPDRWVCEGTWVGGVPPASSAVGGAVRAAPRRWSDRGVAVAEGRIGGLPEGTASSPMTRRMSPVGPNLQRPIRAVGRRIATGWGRAAAGGLRQVQGDRVIGAVHPAAALQDVLAQLTGSLRCAQLS